MTTFDTTLDCFESLLQWKAEHIAKYPPDKDMYPAAFLAWSTLVAMGEE